MDGLMKWLEKYVIPVAAKIGSIRWLVALRDAFIGTLPATMTGSLVLLINVFVNTFPASWGWTSFVKATQPIVAIDGLVYNGTIAVFALVFAFSWGYNLSKAYKVDELAGGIVSTGVYLMSIAQSALLPLTGKITGSSLKAITGGGLATVDGKGLHVTGAFMLSQLGSAGLFTAMIFGGLALVLYIWLMKANITIKMPDSVPPAVSKAFAALIPAFVAFYVFGIVNYLFTTFTGEIFIDWFSKMIQEPLLNASQGFGMVLLITLLVQIFWFFGIHGPNVLAPVLESIWGTAQLRNIDAVAHHLSKMPYMWVRGSFDAYVWMGGSGGTIVLIIAILLFSKRSDERAVAQLSLAPGLFNINEPVMFGIPIVLNAIYFIPFILAPAVMVTIAYFATALGLVSPVRNAVIWVMPPFFNSFLATLGDWRAPILTLVNMAVAFAIWTPFVMASNRVAATDAAANQKENDSEAETAKE